MTSQSYLPGWAHTVRDLHWIVFITVLLAAGVVEVVWPHRALLLPVVRRWSCHAGLFSVTTLLNVPVLAIPAVLLAQQISERSWGVLNSSLLPYPVRLLAGIALLDLTRYAAHWLAHRVEWLWRLHEVHHDDADFDITTGLRFHPIEPLWVSAAQVLVVYATAMPPLSVLLFELAAMGQGVLAHTNTLLPEPADRFVRLFWITPNMHRIHHSQIVKEQNQNLGVLFPWWDRLFGTYRAAPSAGWEGLKVGSADGPGGLHLWRLLWQPFWRPAATAPPLLAGATPPLPPES